jgi:hypothetical protein
MGQGRSHFNRLQIVNDSIGKKIWVLPGNSLGNTLYHIDYSNGLDPKAIRLSRWIFNLSVSSIALINTDELAVSLYMSSAPLPGFLNREGGKVVVDGRNIWEDEIDPFPPLFPAYDVSGGIMIIRKSNSSKHDRYYYQSGFPLLTFTTVNLPILARIRTAYIGD